MPFSASWAMPGSTTSQTAGSEELSRILKFIVAKPFCLVDGLLLQRQFLACHQRTRRIKLLHADLIFDFTSAAGGCRHSKVVLYFQFFAQAGSRVLRRSPDLIHNLEIGIRRQSWS